MFNALFSEARRRLKKRLENQNSATPANTEAELAKPVNLSALFPAADTSSDVAFLGSSNDSSLARSTVTNTTTSRHQAQETVSSMLQVQPSVLTAADQQLLGIWAARYIPDLSLIPLQARRLVSRRLGQMISAPNRQATAAKINQNLISDCAFAGMQAQRICAAAGTLLDMREATILSVQVRAVYEKLLELYVEEFVFAPVLESLSQYDGPAEKVRASLKILPRFTTLIQETEPLLNELQKLYLSSENHLAIGFLTTQLHLTRHRILERLDAYERLWLNSYFQLVEEQVCMPWQRISQAAANPSLPLEKSTMVQQVLPLSQEIGKAVYQRAVLHHPGHQSRQGRIQCLGVEKSSIRDMSMFQAYIWLCVLEDSVSVIEGELLPLCLMVFPSADVDWQLVENGITWLLEAMATHMTPEQQVILAKSGEPIKELFAQAQPQAANLEAISRELRQKAVTQTETVT